MSKKNQRLFKADDVFFLPQVIQMKEASENCELVGMCPCMCVSIYLRIHGHPKYINSTLQKRGGVLDVS